MGPILVADDCPETRPRLGLVLEGADHDAVSASDGREVDWAQASGVLPKPLSVDAFFALLESVRGEMVRG